MLVQKISWMEEKNNGQDEKFDYGKWIANTLRLHINSLTTNAPAQDIYMLSTYFSNMLHFSKAVNLFLVINMLGLWKFGDSFLICLSILTVIFTCT